MQAGDSELTDDEFLDALVNEALSDDRDENAPQFTHAFVSASPETVAIAVRDALQTSIRFQCNLYGVSPALRNASVYVAKTMDGSLLWMRQADLIVAGVISHILNMTVDWMSVYELFTCRAYVQLQNGICVKELLDPEKQWRTNIFVGDDLIGRGIRRFANYEAFCDVLKDDYQPKDTIFDFEKLNKDPKNLVSCIEKYGRLLRIDIVERNMTLTFHGDWTTQGRLELQQKLE